ncbi:hypothetical protein FHX08_004766 [Rhizobium sp. BK529]|uniref:hypothetical protein n=1 Tax=Rhizobium sp. BK529 TaxID=2586983 RepID=UPI00160DAEA1|nr:hypothetical protein [Rhizobium sp. BK529]MBB3594362.1 hypothetical protein [Rhizobium sp. BK529]
MFKLLPDWVPIAGAAVVAFAIGGYLGFTGGTWHGKSLGKEEARAEAAVEAVGRISNMEKNNANFRNLPARDRCLVIMRDSRLPEDNCPER